MKVFLIIVPVFLLFGVWLIVDSRRRGRLVKTFGAAKGPSHRTRDEETLEKA